MDTEAAQPDAPDVEGQGAEDQNGNDLYTGFLDGIPDEIHEQVIPALKAQDAEFTKRFQSRAEQFKPYEELGVFDTDPESIGAYLSLDRAVVAAQQGDEEAKEVVQEWWDSMGEALGFYNGEEEGSEDTADDDFDPYDRNSIASLISQEIQQAVGPIAQHLQQKELTEQEHSALQEAENAIEEQIGQLQEANPNLSEDVIEEVLGLAELFVESSDNPIQAGFEKYQSLVGKGESSLFNSKLNQPNVPEGSGPGNTAAVTPTRANIKDLVQERLDREQSLT